MSGRPLAITQRQLEALSKAASKTNNRIEIRIGNTLVTIIPGKDNRPQEDVDEWENVNI